MEWNPQDALKAYLNTLQLCKVHNDEDSTQGNTSSGIIEPKCMEFISALAAGKRARLMLQITSEGITPLTVSLAVAAKQSGGRLIVCMKSDDDHHVEKISKTLIVENGLDDVIEYVYDIDPCRMMKQFKNIDFAVVDCKFEDHVRLLRVMKFNPNGCIVVVNNLDDFKRDIGGPIYLDQVFKEKRGFRYVTLPLGEEIELTRFKPIGKCQISKRFHVTFEN